MTSESCDSAVAQGATEGANGQITKLVHLFYSRVHADPLIGPIFETFIHDWDVHLAEMCNFWSTHLLGSGTYRGNGFSHHMKLPLEEAHFARWLELWQATANEVLPPDFAQRAIGRALHFAQSYKTGLLPYKRPDGSMSRTPG